MTARHKLERHLFLSDFQIPDHNPRAISAVLKFLPDFQADHLYLLGDMLNFTMAGSYDVIGDAPTLGDEINEARHIIFNLVKVARKANRNVKIIWTAGNHEQRLERYLARHADRLIGITDEDGERLLTVPHMFHLRQHGIKWLDYFATHRVGNIEIEHGFIARSKSGYTAHAQIDQRGRSGFSGHTHKLSLVTRNQGGDIKFWVETGSLCNSEPNPRWMKRPDWTQGFAVGLYDPETRLMHPTPILMQNNCFVYDGRLYGA